MWRPNGWENPHRRDTSERWSGLSSERPPFPAVAEVTYDIAEYNAFEAGADAMLEALKNMGTPTGLKYTAYANERKGYLVLIPDESSIEEPCSTSRGI